MITKPRIGLFGNCQAAEIQRLFTNHAPLQERFELIPIKPVYLMSLEDREAFMTLVPTLDILFCQFTTTNYDPATTDNIRSIARGKVLEFPSMHFTGHMPDIMYLKTFTVKGSPTDYHSTIIASAFDRGLSEEETEAFYDHAGAISYDYLAENYWAGISELKRREKRCEFTVSDFIARKGPGLRLFHTMNHPRRDVIQHVANQILRYLNIEPLANEGSDRLAGTQWPLTAAVSNLFGLAKECLVSFGGTTVPRVRIIASYFNFYRANPHVLETNQEKLNPGWLHL